MPEIIASRQRETLDDWLQNAEFRRLRGEITRALQSHAIEDIMTFIREEIEDAAGAGDFSFDAKNYLLRATGKK